VKLREEKKTGEITVFFKNVVIGFCTVYYIKKKSNPLKQLIFLEKGGDFYASFF
jgi:hypothetical protein